MSVKNIWESWITTGLGIIQFLIMGLPALEQIIKEVTDADPKTWAQFVVSVINAVVLAFVTHKRG